MRKNSKRALYESIMRNVAKQVKKALNEMVDEDEPDYFTKEEELKLVSNLSDIELENRAKEIWFAEDWDWDHVDRVDDYCWEVTTGGELDNGWEFNANGLESCGEIDDFTVEWTAPDGRFGEF